MTDTIQRNTDISRRQLLKLLGGFLVVGAVESVFGKEVVKTPAPSPYPKAYDILWRAYFPMLKQNEGEKLTFYRCAQNKATVGYGSNVQSDPKQLDGITVCYRGKPLSAGQRALFIKGLKNKTAKDLAKYSISRADAEKMAKRTACAAIKSLEKTFTGIRFLDLPVPMQALALDIFYNVGNAAFAKYKKFRKALETNNFVQASSESTVYIGAGKTNKARERRKKRLLNLTQIIQKNANKPLKTIQELVARDYQKNTPKLVRVLSGRTDRICEDALIRGELERRQMKNTMRAWTVGKQLITKRR